jgi:uncharacterized small protein (DUF1192 family)
MVEDDEKGLGAPPKRPMTHEIGQVLDTLSVAELDERIDMLKSEIIRLEETKRFKQDSQAAAAALFKF